MLFHIVMWNANENGHNSNYSHLQTCPILKIIKKILVCFQKTFLSAIEDISTKEKQNHACFYNLSSFVHVEIHHKNKLWTTTMPKVDIFPDMQCKIKDYDVNLNDWLKNLHKDQNSFGCQTTKIAKTRSMHAFWDFINEKFSNYYSREWNMVNLHSLVVDDDEHYPNFKIANKDLKNNY